MKNQPEHHELLTIPGYYTPLTGFPARADIALADLNESGLEAPVSGDATTIESESNVTELGKKLSTFARAYETGTVLGVCPTCWTRHHDKEHTALARRGERHAGDPFRYLELLVASGDHVDLQINLAGQYRRLMWLGIDAQKAMFKLKALASNVEDYSIKRVAL